MRNASVRRVLLALVLGVAALRFVVAALAPISKDESYYLCWSTALDWGYFDHPPAVAWLGVTSWLAKSSAFAGRLGGLILSAFALPFCIGLFRRAGLSEPRALVAASVLAACNLSMLTCGILAVPDTLYFVAWCAALREAAAALDGQPKRWLSVGIATGLGLLSKYMMVLILPVLFLGIVRARPRELRTIWPWAGVLLALAIFSPHLVWNARNDWVPVRFQLTHGYAGSGAFEDGTSSSLPALQPSGPSELELARRFGYERPPSDVREREPDPKPSLFANLGDYCGAVALWWGASIFLVIGWCATRLRGAHVDSSLHAHVRPLLFWSAVVPIAFFGVASLRTHVEANWPAAYTVGASAFLASYAARHVRWLVVGSAINALALVALAIHARTPVFVSNSDRVLKETHGYRELADVVASTEGPVFVDRHQTGALLRFHLPGRDVTQWPGLTRPSEFVRRREWQPWTRENLAARGSFWLVTANGIPPGIEGFHAVEERRLTVRANGGRIETSVVDSDQPSSADKTGKTMHRWFVIHYEVDRGAQR